MLRIALLKKTQINRPSVEYGFHLEFLLHNNKRYSKECLICDFIELKSNQHFNNKEVQGKSTILSWIKIEGQAIRKGDTFAIIQNSNNGAIQYLTSPATGVVASIW